MGAVGNEGGAKSVRRISGSLSTHPTRRAETAHRVDARNLCLRKRQTSAGGRRISLAEFLGTAWRRAHLRCPWLDGSIHNSRWQPSPGVNGHGALHRRRIVYLRFAGDRRRTNREDRQRSRRRYFPWRVHFRRADAEASAPISQAFRREGYAGTEEIYSRRAQFSQGRGEQLIG